MLTAAVVAKGAKTLTLTYSGSLNSGQTWPASSFTIADGLGATATNSSTAVALSSTQVLSMPSTAGLTVGTGTLNWTNTTGILDFLGRVLDPIVNFPLTINA